MTGHWWRVSASVCAVLGVLWFGYGVAALLHARAVADTESGAAFIAGALILFYVAFARVPRTRYLEIDPRGFTVYQVWGDRRLSWEDVAGLQVTRRSGTIYWMLGVTVPMVLLINQQPCRLFGFSEFPHNLGRTQRSVETLQAARLRYVGTR